MPETLLQWCQATSIIIGIAVLVVSYFDKLDNRFNALDKRITNIEYRVGINK
jgi:hypothetical protein